jgi:hypothetical protein
MAHCYEGTDMDALVRLSNEFQSVPTPTFPHSPARTLRDATSRPRLTPFDRRLARTQRSARLADSASQPSTMRTRPISCRACSSACGRARQGQPSLQPSPGPPADHLSRRARVPPIRPVIRSTDAVGSLAALRDAGTSARPTDTRSMPPRSWPTQAVCCLFLCLRYLLERARALTSPSSSAGHVSR